MSGMEQARKDMENVMLSDADFNENLYEHAKFLRDTSTSEVSPIMFIHLMCISHSHDDLKFGDKIIAAAIVGTDFNEEEEKKAVMFGLGKQIWKEHGKKVVPLAIYLGSEAWLSEQKERDVKKEGWIKPSKDPNRVEVMIMAGMTTERRTNFAVWKIDHKGGKVIIDKQPYHIAPYDPIENKSATAEAYILEHFYKGYGMAIKEDIPNIEQILEKVGKQYKKETGKDL